MFVELSYTVDDNDICRHLDLPAPVIKWRARFGDGQEKSNQTSSIEIFCHHGTHIDTPLHVFSKGRPVAEYDVNEFVFTAPLFIDLPKKDLQPIETADLEPYAPQLASADLLLVFTGFSEHRATDPERYALRPPTFTEESARFIIERAPRLRAVGIDFLSIESLPEGREAGWPVHKIFLGSRENFLLIEDMNLAVAAGQRLKRIIVAPLRIGTEGSPAMVLAESEPALSDPA